MINEAQEYSNYYNSQIIIKTKKRSFWGFFIRNRKILLDGYTYRNKEKAQIYIKSLFTNKKHICTSCKITPIKTIKPLPKEKSLHPNL